MANPVPEPPESTFEKARSANRLRDALSPYLLQHAHNPVAWQPWDDQALAQARDEEKPIFLSIGYAACHWCHVMERESFEDEEIAAFLNRHFINIKVDREERPDLDDLYMKAVVAITGQGGWPMSVFLTPDLLPFHGGTYFPPENRYGMPGFKTVLEQVVQAWHDNRSRITDSAERFAEYLRRHAASPEKSDADVDGALLENAARSLQGEFDPVWGGWGGAPKFPSSASLGLLLRTHHRVGHSGALDMVTTTLDKMRQGGIYDQLGGGFHRYSVDAHWRVPHFEKMLYDNAQLAVAYLEAWQVTGNSDYRAVACETLDYLLRDMQDDGGGLYASQDADSDGEEGVYYLWTREEILAHLGVEDGTRFCEWYGVKKEGNFDSHEQAHHGKNVLLPKKGGPEFLPMRKALLQLRCKRTAPKTDDKVLTSWNALALSALAKAALAFDSPSYLEAALKVGAFIRDSMWRDGGLLRSWRQGRAHLPAYLEDYACTANAMIDLYECSAAIVWLDLARKLADSMIQRFHNVANGGFYSTGAEHTHLIVRLQPMHDTAEPSGNAMAALALFRLGAVFGEERYESLARETLSPAVKMMRDAPGAFLSLLIAADFAVHGPTEITLTGDANHPTVMDFKKVIGERYVPNRVLVYAGEEEKRRDLPATRGRPTASPAAWICRDRVCLAPCAEPKDLASQLDRG